MKSYPDFPDYPEDPRYQRRLRWHRRAAEVLTRRGVWHPLPDPTRPVRPEELNRCELAVLREVGFDKSYRCRYTDWDFASLPGEDMQRNPHQSVAVAAMVAAIEIYGLKPGGMSCLPPRLCQKPGGEVLNLFG